MVHERHPVLPDDLLVRSCHGGVEITVVEDDLAGTLEHLLVLAPEPGTAVVRVRALLPFDLERVTSL